MDPTPASSSSSEEDDRSLPREFFDIIIIGAGISGINTARYITAGAPSTTSYAILERRGNLGGTWDLFKYPGIRSDSDMFTFGFSWNPWNLGKPLATGPEITAYLSESAAKVGVDKHIRFHHHVLSASWSSSSSSWTITAKKDNDAYVQYEARFLVLGTGYYNYDEPMQTLIPGLDRFRGDVIKPQFWPEGYKYMNKNIVVIGSGATAVTLLPSLAEDARHVTMLQRSPTYIATMPMTRGIFTRLFLALLPRFVTGPWSRIRHVLMGSFFYYYCKTFPQKARDVLEKASAEQLPRSIPVKPHLSPRYNPWDQRLCVCPDGDFYAALRSSKASIVTDNIKEVTENEIVLESGKKLQPDIIVAATGLQLQFAGGIEISVDGKIVDVSTKFTWKGCMLQDIPNMVFVVGYVNASWTLSAETTAMLFVRLWRRMKTAGARVAIPTLERPEAMKQVSLFYLSSTYFQKSSQVFPKGGLGQWSQKKNHLVDAWESSWGNISDGLVLH